MSRKLRDTPKGKTQVPQVDASLDQPLNVDAPPTIYGTKLKPETASAAINLALEGVKQQESLSNKSLIRHPITGIFISVIAAVFLSPRIILPRNLSSSSIVSYLYQLLHFNVFTFGTLIVITCISLVCLFTVYSRVTEMFFREKISEITKLHGESIFGVNLQSLASRDKKTSALKQVDNTYIIVYRETPIALISIAENEPLSSKESLVMSVSTIACRRVYLKSGIIEDLLDWAMLRTKTICKEGNYGDSMKLLISLYSFENNMKDALRSKGFTLLQSVKLKESRLLGGLYGVQKELWGVQFHFEAPKND